MSLEFTAPLLAAFFAFLILWPISVRKVDASIVDFAWGPGFALQLGVALAVVGAAGPRATLIFALVAVWSARLGWALIGRRLREGHEDPRYTSLRESWGASFWWKSLFIVFILQALLQWLIASGAIAGALAADQSIGHLAWVGAAIALVGLTIETIADWQLDRFKRERPGGLLTGGLRRHVRHPNYSGEILFWSGIAMIGLDAGVWLALVSPILIGFLLATVSGAPMLDERLAATREGYAAYRDRTPAFIPFLRTASTSRTTDLKPGE